MAELSTHRLTPPLSELENLSDDEVRRRYDEANDAGQSWHVPFYRDELWRRQVTASERTVRRLTWAIAGMTLVNVVVVVVALVTD